MIAAFAGWRKRRHGRRKVIAIFPRGWKWAAERIAATIA
jgi:hypothetical protein